MGNKQKAILLIGLTLIAIAVLQAPEARTFVSEPAFPDNIKIIDPLYSVPVSARPGDVVNVTIEYEGVFEPSNIVLLAPGREYVVGTWNVVTQDQGKTIISVQVPPDVVPELYDIVIDGTFNGEQVTLKSPRTVWVVSEFPTRLRILHISDVHIGIFLDSRYAWERYEGHITIGNALNPTVIFITGDDVDVGNDVVSLKIFYSQTNEFRSPTFIVPGNHDWAGISDKQDFLTKFYGRYIGPPYWVRTFGNFTIIGLSSGSEGYFDATQLEWLSQVLDKYSDKTVMILLHHSIFNDNGKVYGNYTNYQQIYSMLYGSWRDHMDSFLKFLKLIDEHPNVVAVFAGHIHRDNVVLYNNRVWFITTTTACGGRPEYRGFRIVDVYANGTVHIEVPPNKDIFSSRSSYNIDYFSAVTYHDSDMITYIYSVDIMPSFELDLENVPLYFFVNASVPPEQYAFYGNTSVIKDYEYVQYGDLLVYKAYVDLTPGTKFTLVLSSYEDDTPPQAKIGIYSPKKPIAGKQAVTFTFQATDEGWGVKEVKLLYKTPSDTEWKSVPAYSTSGGTYRAQLPVLNTPEVVVKVVAYDWAGNKGESEEMTITYAGYGVTTTSPTTTTTQPTTTTTTTTTPYTATTTTTTTMYVTTSQPTTQVTTETPQPEGFDTNLVIGIAAVVIIIVILLAIFKKK